MFLKMVDSLLVLCTEMDCVIIPIYYYTVFTKILSVVSIQRVHIVKSFSLKLYSGKLGSEPCPKVIIGSRSSDGVNGTWGVSLKSGGSVWAYLGDG